MDGITNLVYLFSLATLFCLGLSITADEFRLVMRDKRALGRALLADAVLLPFLMWMVLTSARAVVSQVPTLQQYVDLASGQSYVLLLLALAGGSLLAPALANAAHGRVPYTNAMNIIFALVAVLVLPLGLFILPLGGSVGQSSVPGVLAVLLSLQLAPFLVGFLLRARYADIAAAVRPFASMLANIVFLLLIVQVAAQVALPSSMKGWMALAPLLIGGLILVAAALLIGYFMAGADKGLARGLGVATGLRNVTAVLVVVVSGVLNGPLQVNAAGDGGQSATMVVAWVLISYLVGLIVVTIVTGEWGRKPIVAAPAADAGPVRTVTSAQTAVTS